MRPLEIKDSIYIESPKNLVWQVVEDIDQWPQWTPTITNAQRLDDGPFGLGSKAKIKQPGQPESIWTITEFVPEESFTWEAQRMGLNIKAIHHLKEKESGTISILEIQASGFFAVIFRFILKFAIRRALMQENKGLKLRCEEG